MNGKLLLSVIMNTAIVLMVAAGLVISFTVRGDTSTFQGDRLGIFIYFTVDSNVLCAIVSSVYVYLALRHKNAADIPKAGYVLRLVSTVGVLVTLFVTVFFLAPSAKGGLPALLTNANFFFHLVVPLTSLVSFALFEGTEVIGFRDCLWGIAPVFLYSVFYAGRILANLDGGKVVPSYDFYGFLKGGVQFLPLVLIIMYSFSYVLAVSSMGLNRLGLWVSNGHSGK